MTEHSCVTSILNNEQILSYYSALCSEGVCCIHLLHDNRQTEFNTGFGNEVYRVSGIVRCSEDWDFSVCIGENLASGIIRLPSGWDFSVCTGNRCLNIYLTYDIKNYNLSFVLSFIFDILRSITTISERH